MLPVMETGNPMSRASRWDYLQRVYPRYRKASRAEKQRMLDEFCANCGYHRKHAIRLLNRPLPAAKPAPRRRVRGRTYGPPMMAVLKAVWEAADYPWSVRLKALLPEWMPWIRRRFRLTSETERQLLRISPRSIDYRLRGEKEVAEPALRSHQAGDLAEASHPAQDGSLGRPGAGLRRDRLGVAFGQLGCGRFLLLAQSDRHPHGLDRDPSRAGQEPGGGTGRSGDDPPGLALCLARHRFGQWLGVHQSAPLPLLPGAGHAIHARAALQERRQRAHREEALDPRAALSRL